jgi:hypothetical protein
VENLKINKMKTKLALTIMISAAMIFSFNSCTSTEYTATNNENAASSDTLYEIERASEPVSLETFEDSLSSYGEFVSIDSSEIDPDNSVLDESGDVDSDIYTNYIWVPNSNYLYEGWTPYGEGRWEWTDWGWTWVSDYNWGWAPYHYGRWWYSQAYGWVWSPGRRWGPGWVNWCSNREFTGWYPISPRVRLRNAGISTINHHYNPNGWVGVSNTNFRKHITKSTILPNEKTNEIVKNTTPFVNIKQQGKKLFNSGPSVNDIELSEGKKIVQKPLTEVITFHTPNNGNKNVSETNTKKNPLITTTDPSVTNSNNNSNSQKGSTGVKPKTNINNITNYNTSKTYNSSETYNSNTSNTNKNNNNNSQNTNKNQNTNKQEPKKTETNYNTGNSNKTGSTNKTGTTSPKVNPVPYNPPPVQKQAPPPVQRQAPPPPVQKQAPPPPPKKN